MRTTDRSSRRSRSILILRTTLLLFCWTGEEVMGIRQPLGVWNAWLPTTSFSINDKRSIDPLVTIRGGSTKKPAAAAAGAVDEENLHLADDDETNQDNGMDITKHPDFAKLQAYRMEQQILMQLRATYLSEALVRRGLPLPSIEEVATPEGAKPPEAVDWDCAISTEDDPKECLYTFNSEPNTKLIKPYGSKDWIQLRALNRLRRSDPSKVESLWHMKYAIVESWFNPDSEFSLLQHVSFAGFCLNELLQSYRLHVAVALTMLVLAIVFLPVLEYIINRILVSGFLWTRWVSWHRFVHAALPLKLFIAQFSFSFLSKRFLDLVAVVKDGLVELECDILERSIPLTVGVPDMIPPGREPAIDLDFDDKGELGELPFDLEEDSEGEGDEVTKEINFDIDDENDDDDDDDMDVE